MKNRRCGHPQAAAEDQGAPERPGLLPGASAAELATRQSGPSLDFWCEVDGVLDYIAGSLPQHFQPPGEYRVAYSLPPWNSYPPFRMARGDPDLDGHIELVVWERGLQAPWPERVMVLDGMTGTIEAAFPTTVRDLGGMFDYDGDGVLEVSHATDTAHHVVRCYPETPVSTRESSWGRLKVLYAGLRR